MRGKSALVAVIALANVGVIATGSTRWATHTTKNPYADSRNLVELAYLRVANASKEAADCTGKVFDTDCEYVNLGEYISAVRFAAQQISTIAMPPSIIFQRDSASKLMIEVANNAAAEALAETDDAYDEATNMQSNVNLASSNSVDTLKSDLEDYLSQHKVHYVLPTLPSPTVSAQDPANPSAKLASEFNDFLRTGPETLDKLNGCNHNAQCFGVALTTWTSQVKAASAAYKKFVLPSGVAVQQADLVTALDTFGTKIFRLVLQLSDDDARNTALINSADQTETKVDLAYGALLDGLNRIGYDITPADSFAAGKSEST